MLKESEWKTINNILLNLYAIDDIDILSNKLLKVIRMLIPYTQGYFVMLDDEQKIISERTVSINMSCETMDKYMGKYYDNDYLKYLYEFAEESVVYRDTDILEDNIRKETDFYKNFLKPDNIPYGCGILIIKNSGVLGIFNLFRNDALGDFTDKDIYILNILKSHIENMVYNVSGYNKKQIDTDMIYMRFSEKYKLTDRETEMIKLLSKGLTNKDISSDLCISLATVKAHIYNIYSKTGVKSRTQLINLMMEQGG